MPITLYGAQLCASGGLTPKEKRALADGALAVASGMLEPLERDPQGDAVHLAMERLNAFLQGATHLQLCQDLFLIESTYNTLFDRGANVSLATQDLQRSYLPVIQAVLRRQRRVKLIGGGAILASALLLPVLYLWNRNRMEIAQ